MPGREMDGQARTRAGTGAEANVGKEDYGSIGSVAEVDTS